MNLAGGMEETPVSLKNVYLMSLPLTNNCRDKK